MIDKISGKVTTLYLDSAAFSELVTIITLPWQSLKYDTGLGGYRTNVTEQQLRGAPKYGNDNDWNWSDTDRTRAVNDYYGF